MAKQVLITGGAGFIGSHLADELLHCGYRVRAFDALAPQVHGEGATRPAYLHEDVELVVGDVRDREAVHRALAGVDVVYHLAAAVGVGQSMYEVVAYTGTNNMGTAVLLEELIARPVEKLVVASSMSIYGEGLYRARDGSTVTAERTRDQYAIGQWNVCGPDGDELTPIPTPESKVPALSSVYALSKYDQERLCLLAGEAYGIPTVALRFFNVYGTRQALSNPYTGVLAIFASRLLNDNAPMIFEDGLQQRDFVHVRDVAKACRLALESDQSDDRVLNVGSGERFTVREVAERIAAVLGKSYIVPEISGKYRVGDIRNCFADISRARDLLGYEPAVDFDDGLAELAEWLASQEADDRVEQASRELMSRGLTV
jgi:dTDP-L-rhamnose 4-epimerase